METLWAVLVRGDRPGRARADAAQEGTQVWSPSTGPVSLAVGQSLVGAARVGQAVEARSCSSHTAGRPGRTHKGDGRVTAGLVSWLGGWVVPACFPDAWKGCELG